MPILLRRLSFFYALYFALLGCIAPYWGLYLQHKQFSAEQIGVLMGLFGFVRIIAPNLWAAWAVHFRSPLQMIRLASLLTIAAFVFIPFANGLFSMAIIMMSYGFFWAAMLPQYEVITMQACDNQVARYSRIRLWGSIGFVLMVLGAGALFETLSFSWLPLIMLVLMAVIVLNSFGLPSGDLVNHEPAPKGQFIKTVLTAPVLIFLGMTILLHLSHGPYYTFFSIYLTEHEYSSTLIGSLWALGVVAEILLFWKFHSWVYRLSWRHWCVLSLVITAVRWGLIATCAQYGWVLVIAQLGHAFSFAAMHAVSMRYVQQFFPKALQSRGQAMYSSIGMGFGAALGALLSGLFWDQLGGEWVFSAAALSALFGAVVAWYGLPKEKNQM